MKSLNRSFYVSVFTGLCLAAVSPVMGQNSGSAVFSNISITGLGGNSLAGSMNGAFLLPHVFNDAPASVGTYNNSYPGSILLSEANVQTHPATASKGIFGTSPTMGKRADTTSKAVTSSALPSA